MCSRTKTMKLQKCKSLLEELSAAVDDSLTGIVLRNQGLGILENHRIIMRRDHKNMKGKVKTLGGGGAGLEPADACYVGAGMLTAAVVGEIFTAPSASTILVAIRELAFEHADGILVIVKNYGGDLLNFQLALERAQTEDINVRMLIVADDGSELNPGKAGRRGLAGCIFLYKIAGAMAEAGKGLFDIFTLCSNLCLSSLCTVGVTLSTCCGVKDASIKSDEMVLGMGAHGEGGVKHLKLTNAKEAVTSMLDVLSDPMSRIQLGDLPVAVLVNNFGSSTKLEENVVSMETMKQLSLRGVIVSRQFSGTFMSCMDTHGFSVTILKLSSRDVLTYLDSPTSAPGWPRQCCAQCADSSLSPDVVLPIRLPPSCDHAKLEASKLENMPLGPSLPDGAAAAVEQILSFASEALISCERQINLMDSELGDGDAGTVLRSGAEAIKSALKEGQLELSRPFLFLQSIGQVLGGRMGGTTGALYDVFFTSSSKVFQTANEVTPQLWCAALRGGVEAVQHYGKAELGDRSLVDALSPAVDAFEAALLKEHPSQAFYVAVAVGEYEAGLTKSMVPRVGKAAGRKGSPLYPDAGAHAAAIWLRAVSEGVRLRFPPP